VNSLDFIEKKSNEELVKEFEWMINRITSYNTSDQVEYKEMLKTEILKRINTIKTAKLINDGEEKRIKSVTVDADNDGISIMFTDKSAIFVEDVTVNIIIPED
jgi:hypothetical protein